MLMVNNLVGHSKVSVPPEIIFVGSNYLTPSGAVYTFTSQSIGTPAADRIVIVGTGGRTTGTNVQVNGMTIAGVTATLLSRHVAESDDCAGLFAAKVPAGATGDIVVTYSTTVIRGGIFVWTLYKKDFIVPFATYTDAQLSGLGAQSVNVPPYGAALCFAYDATSTTRTPTLVGFTNSTNVTIVDEPNSNKIYGAWGNNINGGTASFNISWDTDSAIAMASFALD